MVGIVAGSNWGLRNSSLNVLGANGVFGQAQLGSNGQRTYVDIASGRLVIQQRDEFVSSVGRDLSAVRTFNSSNYAEAAGNHQAVGNELWSMLPMASLLGSSNPNTPGATVLLVEGDGSRTTLTYDAARHAYVSTDGGGAHATVTFDSTTQEYTLHHGEPGHLGDVDVFAGGNLIRSSDESGAWTTYQWSSTRVTVTDATGDAQYYNFENGLLTSITEQAAGTTNEIPRVAYIYDDHNRLARVDSYLFAEGDENTVGTYSTTYGYLGETARVSSISQSDGTAVSYTYDPAGRISKVIDAYGRETSFTYNANSTTVTEPTGASTVYTYESNGTGNGSDFSGSARLTSVTTPAVNGVTRTTRYSYDAQGNLARMTSPSGLETTFEYDANGNCTLQRDAAGNTVTRRYDQQTNRLLSQTTYRTADPDGAGAAQPSVPETEFYVYDTRGNLRFHISAAGAVQEYRYDARSQTTSAITYNAGRFPLTGYSSTVAPTEATMANWVASSVSQRDNSVCIDYTYDARGLRSSATTYNAVDAAGNGIAGPDVSSTETYVHDQFGSLLQKIDGDHNLTSYRYDVFGRMWNTTDANQHWTYNDYQNTYIDTLYDTPDFASEKMIDAGTGQITYEIGTDYKYNVGRSTNLTLDAVGRVLVVDKDGATYWNLYDAAGRKVGEVDPTGTLTEYVYDADNRVVAQTTYATRTQSAAARSFNVQNVGIDTIRPAASSNDRTTRIGYDAANRLARKLDADGYLTTFQYDGESQLVAQTLYANSVTSINATPDASSDDRIERSFYDADGRLTGRIDADGYATEWRYNGSGQVTDTIRYATVIAPAARTAFNPVTNANDIRERNFYDAKGQLAGVLDGENFFTARNYDGAGNLSGTRRYATRAGTPTAATIAGLGLTTSSKDQITGYTYTALNQLKTETAPDGAVTIYDYDRFGTVINIIRNANSQDIRTTTRRVDAFGQVRDELNGYSAYLLANGGDAATLWAQYASHYTYDERGRAISFRDADNHTTLFFYDEQDREVMRVNGTGEVQETRYNAFGEVEQKITRNQRLSATQLTTLKTVQPGQSAAARTAAALSMSAVLASPDERVQNFRYDHRGEVVDQWEGGDPDQVVDQVNGTSYHTRTTYDAFGDVLKQAQQTTDGSGYITTGFTYDHRGNRLTTTPFLKPTLMSSVVYDAFGRVTATTDANHNTVTTGYDRLNHAILVKDATPGTLGTATTYDAFNRVLSQRDALGATTTYVYDDKARTMVVTTAEGVVHTTTWNAFGQTVSVKDAANNITTYTYEGDGSISQVKDNLGVISRTVHTLGGAVSYTVDGRNNKISYSYDAAGRVLTRTVDPDVSASQPGLKLSTTYAYDAQGRVLTVTDPNGVVTRTGYDRKGQVKTVTVDATGSSPLTTSFAYDSRGNKIRVTDPNGTVTAYTYDENGYAQSAVLDPDGLALKTSVVYDATGTNIVLREDSGGRVTRMAYDANNLLTWQVGPDGTVTHYEYDADHRLVKSTQYAHPSTLITSNTPLDAVFTAAQIAASVNADATRDIVNRTIYDKDGRAYATIDGTGSLTVNLSFDSEGRITEQVSYATKLTAAEIAPLTTSTAVKAFVAAGTKANVAADARTLAFYDVRGQLTMSARMVGYDWLFGKSWSVTEQKFDLNGNLLATTTFDTLYSSSSTPTRSQLTTWITNSASKGASNVRIRRTYDNANRLTATATAISDTQWALETLEYDAAGNVTARRAYAQPQTASGEPVVASMVAAAVKDPADHQLRFAYDTAGRMVASAEYLDKQNGIDRWALTRQTYDADGNVTTRTRYATALTSASLPASPTAANYASWLKATVVATTGAQTSRYAYDQANRLTIAIDPAGAVTGSVYDAAGNVVRQTAYATADTGSGPITSNYTPVTSADDRTSYAVYDKSGHAVLRISAGGAITATSYDALGQVQSTYQYATLANLAQLSPTPTPAALKALAMTSSLDRKVQYAYNADGKPIYKVDAGGYLTGYAYDALGNLTDTTEYVNAPTTAVSADGFLSITSVTADARDHKVHYVYDQASRNIQMTDADGTEQYRYNAIGRRTGFTNKAGAYWDYQFNAAGQVMREMTPQMSVSEGTLSYESGKYTLNASAVTTTLYTEYTYDVFGNLLSKKENANSDSPSRVTSYAYDTANRQIRTEYPEVTWYDTTEDAIHNNGSDGEAARAETAVTARPFSTVIYDVLGNAISGTDVNGNTSYKAYDKDGRVLYETDAKGYVTGHHYNTFGEEDATTRYAEKPALTAATAIDAASVAAALQAIPHGADRTIQMQYDKAGNKIQVREPSAYTFDSSSGTYQDLARTTQYTYSAFGEVLSQRVFGSAGNTQVGSAQATYSFYGNRGRLELQAQVVAENGDQLEVYLTSMGYDSFGNLSAQTEYANSVLVTRQSLESANRTRPAPSADPQENDRTTNWEYDALNRKTKEIRVNVAYEDGRQMVRGNVTTGFGYDKVGNQTRVTDAAGNNTYTYYDALGRVAATATVHADNSDAPLTVFKRNRFGDIVQRIDYALGATATSNATSYAIKGTDAAHDRVSGNMYDGAGRVIVSVDAEGHTTNTSYDKAGRVAKVWQRVTDANGIGHNAFQITHYDELGNVVQVDTPSVENAADGAASATVTQKAATYNAFGEVTARAYKEASDTSLAGTSATSYVTNKYDKAGNLWSSNEGDGIDKIQLFDVFGNATSTITSTGTDKHALASLTAAKEVLTRSLLARTDRKYDLLGRMLDQRQIDTQVQVLERDEHDNWIAAPRKAGNVQMDSLIVVGSLEDTNTAVTLKYRLHGSAEWLTADGDRLKNINGYIVFSTAGLGSGEWDYVVSVQHTGSQPFDRSSGSITLTSAATTAKAQNIARLYVAILGRLPDTTGLNFYLSRLNAGATLAEVAKGLMESDEARKDTSNTAMVVRKIVEQALGRDIELDPGVYARYDALANCVSTPGSDAYYGPAQAVVDFLDDLWNYSSTDPAELKASQVYHLRVDAAMMYAVTYSGESLDTTKTLYADAGTKTASEVLAAARNAGIEELGNSQLAQLYVMLFGRAPDVVGRDFYMADLKAGASIEAIAAGMLVDAEGREPFNFPSSGLTQAEYNEQMVVRVFRHAVARDPSAAELADWTAKLNGSATVPPIGPGAFLMQFAQSISNYSGTDPSRLDDRSVFNNRVAIGLKFVQLGRPETVEISRQLIAAVKKAVTPGAAAQTASLEFRARADSGEDVADSASAAAQAKPLEAARTDLARLYVALFNRVPDSTGFAYYMGDNPTSAAVLAAIANDMLQSQESRSGTGANYVLSNGVAVMRNNRDFIEQVYRQMLGYVPSSGSALTQMDSFVTALQTKSRGEVVVTMIDQVMRMAGASTAERAARAKFDNKAAVGVAYAVDLVCEDIPAARTVAAMVTDTNIADALTYAYQQAQAQAAAAAAATGAAASAAATVVLTDAGKLDAMLRAYASETSAQNVAATVPTALYRLQIAQLYLVLLGRQPESFLTLPDLDGMDFYADKLTAGFPLSRIAEDLLADDEGRESLPASLSNDLFVNSIYQRVLGVVDPAQAAVQVAKLDSGTSRGQVALDIMNEVLFYFSDASDAANASMQLNRTWFLGRIASALNNIATAAATQQVKVANQLAVQLQNKADAERDLPGLFTAYTASLTEPTADEDAAASLLRAADSASGNMATRRIMVVRMMNLLQGRTSPTLAQIDAYATSGQSLESIADSMIAAIPGFPPANTPITDTVNALYERILGRPRELSEPWWVEKMGTGITRGAAAVGMIFDLEDHFTDFLTSELVRKKTLDETIQAVLQGIKTQADTDKDLAYDAANDASRDYSIAWNALEAARDTEAYWSGQMDATITLALYGPIVQANGNRDDLTYVNYILGEPTDIPSLYHQLNAGETGSSKVDAWVASQGGSSDEDFLSACYSTCLGWRGAPDAAGWAYWIDKLHSGAPRETVAYDMFHDSDPSGHYSPAVSSLMQAQDRDIAADVQGYDTAVRQWHTARANVNTAFDNWLAAGTAYDDAIDYYDAMSAAADRFAALVTFESKLIEADQSYLAAAPAADAYTAAKAKLDTANTLIPQLTTDRDSSVLMANAESAASNVASASSLSAADTWAVIAGRLAPVQADAAQVRTIVQLYTTLLGHSPALTDIQYWRKEMAAGRDAAGVALGILDGQEAAASGLFTSLSAGALLQTMYMNGLGHAADATGLAYWSAKLPDSPSRADYALLAAQFTDSLTRQLNADTLTFDHKIAMALQGLVAAAASVGVSPDLHNAIWLADRNAVQAADGFDSANRPTQDQIARDALLATQLYVGLFNRAPGADLLLSLAGPLAQGTRTPLQVALSVLALPEAQSAYPASLQPADLCSRVFFAINGRQPSDTELASAVATYTAGGRAQLALNLVTALDGRVSGDLFDDAWRNAVETRVQSALQDAASDLARTTQANDTLSQLALAISGQPMVEVHPQPVTLGIDATLTDGQVTDLRLNQFRVDRWGNVLSVLDPRDPGWVTHYQYNSDNRVVAVSYPAIPGDSAATGKGEESRYDILGRMTESTDARGYSSRITYNSNNYVVRQDYADQTAANYTVDIFGNRTSITQGNGVTFTYRYDKLGHQTKRISQQTAIYGSDLTSMNVSSQLGTVEDTYGYDEFGRQISVTTTDTSTLQPNNKESGTRTFYDLDGNVVKTANVQGEFTTRHYFDAFGHEIKQVDGAGGELTWKTDEFGQVASHTDLGHHVSSYTYDAAGRQTQVSTAGTGQDIRYTYNSQGQLVYQYDGALQKGNYYRYDDAGHRVSEQLLQDAIPADGTHPAVARAFLQDQTVSFDRLGHMKKIESFAPGAVYSVEYGFDANGNRLRQTTRYTDNTSLETGVVTTIDVLNTFDAMNRQLTSDTAIMTGTQTPNSVTHEVHTLTYDGAGNRSTETETGGTSVRYAYDALGRLSEIHTNDDNDTLIGYRHYDAAGHVIASLDGHETRVNNYDGSGHVLRTRVTGSADGNYDVFYIDTARQSAYDGAGNLKFYSTAAGGASRDQETLYSYDFTGGAFDSLQQTKLTVSAAGHPSASTYSRYDANGHLAGVSDDGSIFNRLVTDSEGHILTKTDSSGTTTTLIVNGEVVGTRGPDGNTFTGSIEKYTSPALAAAPTVYVVQSSGESLQSIAQAVWGDGTLWYLIAEANGGIGNTGLVANQALALPARVNTVHNSATTFRPYDASAAIGDTTPVLPPPTAQDSGGGGGCGAWGKIITIAVAVVATVATGGAMMVAMGASNSILGGAALLASGGTGFGTALAAGAVAGAAGSFAGQTAGIMLGMQDGYNWRGVAMGALTGAATAGTASQMNGITNVFTRAALSNVASQATLNLAHLQSGFQWRSVVASGLGAVAGQAVSNTIGQSFSYQLGDWNVPLASKLGDLGRSAAAGFTSGIVGTVVSGGRVDVRQIAADAFGNALGSSLVGGTNGGPADAHKDTAHRGNGGNAPILQTNSAEDLRDAGLGSLPAGTRFIVQPDGLDNSSVATTLGASRVVDGMPQVDVVGQRPGWFDKNVLFPLEDAVAEVGQILEDTGKGFLEWANDTFVKPSGSTDEIPQNWQPYVSPAATAAARQVLFSSRPSGPAFVAVDPAAEARARELSLRNGNNLAMGLGGPFVAAPMLAARQLGANETQVGQAGMLGLSALEAYSTSMGGPRAPIISNARGPVLTQSGRTLTPDLDANVRAMSLRANVLRNIADSQAARASSNFDAPKIGLTSREWPPFPGSIDQVERDFVLLPGAQIDRFGPPQGSFLSPADTAYGARALKPGTLAEDYYVYEVLRPLPVKAGDIRPWFGEVGNGTQYRLDPIDGVHRSPATLTAGENPFLKEIYVGKYWQR